MNQITDENNNFRSIEQNSHIEIVFIYINLENEITSLRQSTLHLNEPNQVSEMDLLSLITSNNFCGNIKYKYSFLLKYNTTLNNDNIISFLDSSFNHLDEVHCQENIKSISFQNSMVLLQSINTLYIIYKCISPKSKGYINTKRNISNIKLKPNHKNTKKYKPKFN